MTAETHEFQTEVKQLLDLMIHSLYTNKDVFLRELISNASDALDKIHFEALTDSTLLPEGDSVIFVDTDPEKRTLTVRDNGIGMTHAEVVENIGTIARSGTKEFASKLKEAKDAEGSLELIGQFGVGFYASFMVADRVELVTRKAGEEHATRWISEGAGTYSIESAERDTCGTSIILHLKEVDEEDGLSDYLQEWTVRSIIKKYSDFVTYPSLWEGWGNQFLEALRARLPVMLFEYPVYNEDIGPKGFKVVSLGAEIQAYDQAGLAQVAADNVQRAADEALVLLTTPQARQTAVEHNFELGKEFYSMVALRDHLDKLMSD